MTRPLRLLFLTKRHPQQRDLIERPYGRFHHLPAAFAGFGHEVEVLLCSHRGLPSIACDTDGVRHYGIDVRTLGLRATFHAITAYAAALRPDWIVGVSDIYYGWLAQRLAETQRTRFVVDAYDNFESYMPWNSPLHFLWRRSVRNADLVTAAGPQLAERLQSYRQFGRPVEVVPMAADPQFRVRDRQTCRSALGLPDAIPLLGYIGSWAQSRGTHLILDAFRRVRKRRPEACLVLSGHPPKDVLRMEGVIGLGYLPDAQLPLLVSSLDVACIVVADNAFGRYSYPAKLYEAMACRVPVVASATDAVRWILEGRGHHLAALGDADDFAQRVLEQLEQPVAEYGARPDWVEVARELEQHLRTF